MLQEGDRRHYPRRTFRDAAQAFHAGHHFEGTPDDISVGGMFLATSAVDQVQPNEVLGILLDGDAGFDPPLFLYARAVRIRRDAKPGLGLRWERAGSSGDADDLAMALELLFAIPASSFLPSITTGAGRIKTTYLFPRQEAPSSGRDAEPSNGHGNGSGRPLPPLKVRRLGDVADAPYLGKPDQGPIGLSVTDDELDELDVKVCYGSQSRQGRSFKRAFDVDTGIVEPTPLANGKLPVRDTDDTRQIKTQATVGGDDDDDEVRRRTARIHRRVPVRFEGVMSAAHIDVPVLVTGLGSTSVFVESTLAPLDRAARVGLRIDVRVRDGVHKFWLNCGLEKIHEGEYGTPPGVELKILAFDEPQQRDEYARLVEAARSAK